MRAPELDYVIRPLEAHECPALEALIADSVRSLGLYDYTQAEIDASLQYVFGVDSELVEDGTYFVVEREGEYLACGGWSRRRTLYGSNRCAGRESGYLDPQTEPAKMRAFFVHPAYARRGIGTALMRHCEACARAHGFSAIEMGATLTGVKLFRQHGYEALAPIQHPMTGGLSLTLVPMRKSL